MTSDDGRKTEFDWRVRSQYLEHTKSIVTPIYGYALFIELWERQKNRIDVAEQNFRDLNNSIPETAYENADYHHWTPQNLSTPVPFNSQMSKLTLLFVTSRTYLPLGYNPGAVMPDEEKPAIHALLRKGKTLQAWSNKKSVVSYPDVEELRAFGGFDFLLDVLHSRNLRPAR